MLKESGRGPPQRDEVVSAVIRRAEGEVGFVLAESLDGPRDVGRRKRRAVSAVDDDGAVAEREGVRGRIFESRAEVTPALFEPREIVA